MTESKYPQIVRFVAETPWAILPSAFAPIAEMIALRASGHEFTAEEIEARIGGAPANKQPEMQGTVAVLPLYGVLVPRADIFSQISGGTSLERWGATFEAAVADDNIDAILICVDSPGGSIELVTETAALVREARGSKPIVAIANTTAASAAYHIAAQADEVVVTPSGQVGSVGVIAAHTDLVAAQEQAGIKTTLVTATDSPYKGELSPFAHLSETALAALQARIDDAMGLMVADIAAGRGVSEAKVIADFGGGRVVTPEDALKAGMVDRIATFEDVAGEMVARAASEKQPSIYGTLTPEKLLTTAGASMKRSFAGHTFADEASDALNRVAAVTARAEALTALRKGRPQPLSAANRERLTALRAEIASAGDALDGLLASTDPAEPALREEARKILLASLGDA